MYLRKMTNEKVIFFNENTLFSKSVIILPPSLTIKFSPFLTNYYRYTCPANLLDPILRIIQSNIKLHKIIRINHSSSFANNKNYVDFYKKLVNFYILDTGLKITSDLAYEIINYINFSIYLLLSLITIKDLKIIESQLACHTILCKDSLISLEYDNIFELQGTFNSFLYTYHECNSINIPYNFVVFTDKIVDKFSLAIMTKNDNKK